MLTLTGVSSKFDGVRMNGDKNFLCLCPCHEDTNKSLVVSINGKWVNAYCFGPCDEKTIARGLQDLGFNKHSATKTKRFKDEQGRTLAYPFPGKLIMDFALEIMKKNNLPERDNVFVFNDIKIPDKPKGFTARIDYPNGDKIYKCYTVWKTPEKEFQLLAKGWPKGIKNPLYFQGFLDEEIKKIDYCFIFEGEKKARASFHLFRNNPEPTIHCAWPLGGKNVHLADWTELEGLNIKEFVLFPDNDDAGRTAMTKVADIVSKFGGTVSIIDTSSFPEKWDIADLVNISGFMQNGKGEFLGKDGSKTPEHFKKLMELFVDRSTYEAPKEAEPRQFAYIEGMERFYDLKHKIWNTEKGFNNIMAPITQDLRYSNTFHKDTEAIRAQKITFDPKIKEQIFEKDGTTFLNDYEDPKPKRVKGDITKFLNHLAYLVPDELNLEYLIKWIAFCIQNPGLKLMCSILMMSEVEGVGKTTIFKMMRYCLGRNYAKQVQQRQVSSQFNDWAVNKLLIAVEEIAIKGDYEARATSMDIYKFLITEDTLNINLKNEKNFDVPNFINCLFFSNNPQPITLTPWSRRFGYGRLKQVQK